MKKNISRNPLWPDWYNGKKIDEVQFGRAFLEQWPLKCVNGTLYTLDGPVEKSQKKNGCSGSMFCLLMVQRSLPQSSWKRISETLRMQPFGRL